MSASHDDLKGFSRVLNSSPKVLIALILIAVILEFAPNQNIFKDFINLDKNKKETVTKNSNNILENYKIVKVVDGDTVDVENINTKEVERVRLIGINTPESVDPRREVECFGKEASDYVKSFEGSRVYLVLDDTQSAYDKYNRLLAYIYFEDGQMLNKKLIADGYAYEYTYSNAYKFQREFKDAQNVAKLSGRGLWGPDTCNGQK